MELNLDRPSIGSRLAAALGAGSGQHMAVAGSAALAGSAASAQTSGRLYDRGIKRGLDLAIVALVALPVLMVVLMLLALIALDGRSPLYVQTRIGKGGRTFRMWKLRSMVHEADKVLEATLAQDPEARAEWDHHQKLRRDPRITPIGRVIRKTSLDELPQLLNVALGDMSIVGPRPMMPSQRVLYPGTEYFAMRPGITGLWQISSRNDSSFSERAQFDRKYLEALSLSTDLGVIARTFRVVLRGTGY